MTKSTDKPSRQSRDMRRSYGNMAYRWYALAVMTLLLACNALDRAIPNLLVEPIRHEFGLNDTQLSLVTGLAYALSYSLAVLPMGYISDRGNRRNLLAVCVILWSAFTALGGFARTYVQLLIARFCVGATESGAMPTMLPMISDIFPSANRGRAFGVLFTHSALGSLLSGIVGGYLAHEYGWRAAFLAAGLPGVLLALLLMATVKEPKRGEIEASEDLDDGAPPTWKEAALFLVKSPGLICLIGGSALFGMTTVTVWAWIGSFFIRVHHLSLKEVGGVIGIATGLGPLIGPLLMGWLGDMAGKRDVRLPLVMMAGAALIAMLCGMVMLFTASVGVAIVMLFLHEIFKTFAPICFAATMNNTPARLRGSVMAIDQLVIQFVSFGLGPLLAGILSDLYGGATSIRYAVANVLGVLIVVAILFLAAARLLYGPDPAQAHGKGAA